ncbi:MAG: hypothetical protein H0U20_02575 [Thermoleophilaceae bacterium]|jgi:hypothetical protein|nr:hypothetical protein [Thermoleophilaceae bacterium]
MSEATWRVRPPVFGNHGREELVKTILKVALGIVLGLTVLVVGCVAVIGAGVDEAEKERQEEGISLGEFRDTQQGASERQVRDRLGKPESAQQFENQIPELQDQPSRSSCIYYPERGKPLFEGRSFQFCFDEGRLTSKNAY